MSITLLCLSHTTSNLPTWPLGQVYAILPTVTAINQWLNENHDLEEFCLFWDVRLGKPPTNRVRALIQQSGDVWHSGLRLNMMSLPRLMDFVRPTWPLHCDPDPNIEATSWRLSLQACLVRTDILKQTSNAPYPAFATLSGAGLELGHRWLWQGAFMRHVPDLVSNPPPITEQPTLADEFLFVGLCYERFWLIWALYRACATGYPLAATCQAFWRAKRHKRRGDYWPSTFSTPSLTNTNVTISVLIPTLNRYPYLFQVLNQLRQQTIAPHEIIVVDQTETRYRQLHWPTEFSDLPLHILWQDRPGQCSSRNIGLLQATGDYILFLDDDDEISPDLIANHVAFLHHYGLDASCGVAEEVGAGALPTEFTYVRDSDVFPTNNTLLKRTALYASGLFDLAYEHGERADGDLGMRLYLNGKLSRLNPSAQVIHHHAPRGGLRQHHARIATRANSRASITKRHLLAPTEGYLWSRYFSPRQVHEALLIRTFSTIRGQGSRWQQIGRFLLMLILLPFTYHQNLQRLKQGQAILQYHPTIPDLDDSRLTKS